MAITTINSDAVIEYSLPSDTSEDKTIFLLGSLDSFVRAHIFENHQDVNANEPVKTQVATNHMFYEFVRFGLKGWRHLLNIDGQEVQFKTEEVNLSRIGKRTVASEESMKYLDNGSLENLYKIGTEIINHSRLSVDEAKN